MFSTETKIRVRYAETDKMNVVYHGNYALYFETARAESVRDLGFTYKEIEAMDIIMPIVEMHCIFIRPAHYDDLLTVKTILKELPADHRITYDHEVYNEKGKLITTGKIVLYFLHAGSKQKASMPIPLLNKLKPFFDEKI